MVTKERRFISIDMVTKVLHDDKASPEEKVASLEKTIGTLPRRRQRPAPPAPKGGITLSEAARRYNVLPVTLGKWRKRGFIETLLETSYEIFVSEESVARAVKIYSRAPGRGKRTLIKAFAKLIPPPAPS